MGIFSTLKSALGLDAGASPPAGPLTLTEGAVARLQALPDGAGIELRTAPAPAGWVVHVNEGPLPGDAHEAFEGFAVACSDEVFDRLFGLQLDHDGEVWRVRAEVRVRARETPNPNGRLYLVDRALSDGRLYFGADASGAPFLVHRLLQRDDIRSVLVRGNQLTAEREPNAPWDAIDQAVSIAIREHVLAAGGTLRAEDGPERDDLEAAVWTILEHRVLPGIHRDGGDLELIGVDDGVVKVHLVGACASCPASTLTLKHGIEATLRDAFPGEIDAVESV